MNTINETTLSQTEVERLAAADPEWLRNLRLTAWSRYEAMPMPGPKDEAWRHTDLKSIDLATVQVARPHAAVSDPASLPGPLQRVAVGEAAPTSVLLQWDGSAVYSRLDPALASQGVILTDIQTAAREHADLIRPYLLTDCVQPGESKFTALHSALLSGGLFLYVPKNVVIEQPVEFAIHVEQNGAGIFNHTLVVAEAGAAVTLMERSSAAAGVSALHAGVVEIFARPGAQVRFGSVQNWSESVKSFTVRRALVERDARVDWTLGEFGGRLARAELTSRVKGPGAGSDAYVVYFGSDEQHLDISAGMVHEPGADHSDSDVQARGVLTGKSRSVYRGLGQIRSGAKACKTFQRQQTLLLSDEARSDAIPGLLIDEYDVEQAGHAASTGQVDRDHLFYLMSRGIPEREALRLIVAGFFVPLMERIPVPALRAELAELIEKRMQD